MRRNSHKPAAVFSTVAAVTFAGTERRMRNRISKAVMEISIEQIWESAVGALSALMNRA